MTDITESKGIESEFSLGTNANDVVAIEHTTMATEEPSVLSTHKDYRTLIGASGAGSVSALTLNDTAAVVAAAAAATATATPSIATTTTTTTTATNVTAAVDASSKCAEVNSNSANETVAIDGSNNPKMIDTVANNINSANNNNVNGGAKGKRRRRKSKQMNNSKPYKKSNWKFQVPRSRDGRVVSMLVPYNTNKFLMEEHMPEFEAAGGRYRDSSFSIDSDETFDEAEFLSKEFSSVYESARVERLDGMNKQQLIQEYLQMEATYDKLCNSLRARNRSDCVSNDCSMEVENQNHIKRLEGHIKELTTENLELRRQMADIRSREHHSPPNGRHRHHSSSHSSKRHTHRATGSGSNAAAASSEDSESDSTSSSSSSSSSSNSSKSSSDCRSKLRRSRSRSSCSSKSSLSDPNHMSGISDAEEAMHLLNGCDSNGANATSAF